MTALLVYNDRGAVATDWVALTAGIIVLGMMVAYSVLGDSRGYLQATFDELNRDLRDGNNDLVKLERSIEFDQAPANGSRDKAAAPAD